MSNAICDVCEKAFIPELKKTTVNIEGEKFDLTYFSCPYCKTIYKVAILDKEYYKIKNDLDIIRSRIRRSKGDRNVYLQKKLNSMMVKKSNELKVHEDSINKRFKSGFFTFSLDGGNEKELVIYVP